MTEPSDADTDAALLEVLVARGLVDPERPVGDDYLAAIEALLVASTRLQDQPGAAVADLVHAALRSYAVTDGAPPEDMAVLTSPDLQVDLDAETGSQVVDLPAAPRPTGGLAALRSVLDERRSMPYFSPRPVTLIELATLLEHAVGTRSVVDAYNRRDLPLRRFPSAGGLQPVDIHVIARDVDGLVPGTYRHNPVAGTLVLREEGDFGVPLVEAAIQTDWLYYAPVVVVLVGRPDRIRWKYGSRGYRYLLVDTGCAYLALHLVAQAMGLFANALAAFDDDRMNALLRLDGRDHVTNLLLAVGHPPARWE